MLKSYILALLSLCIVFSGKAQIFKADSSLLSLSLKNTNSLYDKEMANNLALLNGREYVTSDLRIQGFPSYESEDLEEGSVVYFGQEFKNISCLYDIFTDEFITEHFYSGFRIVLNSERVSEFNLLGHTFKRIENDSLKKELPKTGFYDFLYENKTDVVAKRKKIIFEEIRDRSVYREYQSSSQYFIKKGEIYYPVKSKKSVLNVFENHKKDVNKALRKNKIKFRQNREQAIILMASEYDKLSVNE
jgi:hypothetical protein